MPLTNVNLSVYGQADLVRYHIVRGNYTTDLLNGTLEALDGNVIVSEPIDIDNERIIAVNDAYVITGDRYFDNGVLHIVSKVIRRTTIGALTRY